MVKSGVLQNRPNTIFLLIIFREILFNTPAVFAAEENSRSGYFVTRENKRLPDHVVKRFGSPSLMSCSQSCLRRSWCTSTNFKESFKPGDKGTCELNKHDSAPIKEDTELVDQPGVTFSMFLKGCLMTGCLNGGSCLFDNEKETFSCSCKLPWSGENCGANNALSFRFTTLGMQGSFGPISTAGYTNTTLQGAVTLDKGIQIWTVPLTAMFSLTVAGASGGDTQMSSGGKGAVVRGMVRLVKGTQLRIMVGQKGKNGPTSVGGSAGGGGGTFVTDSNNTLLAAAGGGGGGGLQVISQAGDNGQPGENGSIYGGTNGLGGRVQGTEQTDAGGGGGFIGNGMCCSFKFKTNTCTARTCGEAGRSFLNGGLGGFGISDGGFGGGGAACIFFQGGGGGYSGGGVRATTFGDGSQWGGGGSYCTGGLKSTNSTNDGDGYVLISVP